MRVKSQCTASKVMEMDISKSDLVIVGAGGHALEVVWLAKTLGRTIRGILDDACAQEGVDGVPLLGDIAACEDYVDCEFVIAVGDSRARKRLVEKIEGRVSRAQFATLIHPSVTLSDSWSAGPGTVIAAGSIISAHVEIGAHCIVNLNSSLSHEVIVGDYCTIAPNVALAGRVHLEDLVEIGLGAGVKQGIVLGKGSMLGMGSFLLTDIPENNVYVGVPAKFLRVI